MILITDNNHYEEKKGEVEEDGTCSASCSAGSVGSGSDRSGSVNGCIGSYDRKLGGYYLLHDRNDLDKRRAM